jgi:hypothetical protein
MTSKVKEKSFFGLTPAERAAEVKKFDKGFVPRRAPADVAEKQTPLGSGQAREIEGVASDSPKVIQ